jgi:hypothetical protein
LPVFIIYGLSRKLSTISDLVSAVMTVSDQAGES